METTIKHKILLVDDRPENILVLENILEEENREFIKAYSGIEALKCLLKDDFALILLDVQMPEMDGFEAASIIRSREKSKNIPIIFVTAISKEDKNIFKGYEAGAVDFMHKPVNPDILKSKVKIFLELDCQKQLLEQQNNELVFARKNTDNIFNSIEEGLFLLDEEYNIQPQYSAALQSILDENQIANNNFLSVLKNNINSKDYNNACDYFDLLFKDDVDEFNFKELNPLINIEYQHINGKVKDKKYLSFHFKRIFEGDQISKIMATVMDNTEQIVLENKLKETEAKSKRQVKLLQLFQTEPQLLNEFLQQTKNEISVIKTEIDKNFSSKKNIESMEVVYRLVHSIKGNANLLNLEAFANTAHEFEDMLSQLSEKSEINKTEKGQLHSYANQIDTILEEINLLIKKLKQFYENFNDKNSQSGDLLNNALKDLIKRLNDELIKKVQLNYKDFNSTHINPKDFLLIKDVLIQLIRNSMFHGIEEPKDREKNKKSKTAKIILSSNISKDKLTIKVKDDGRGIQIDKLKNIAISSKKCTKDQLGKWDDNKIANLIFEQGITTSEQANLVAGRGVGMPIIKKKVNQLGGKIDLNFEVGKFTEFTIEIPIKDVKKEKN